MSASRVTRNGMRLDHLHAREDRAEVRGDELLEPDEVVGAAALARHPSISHDGPAPAAAQIGTSRGSARGILTRAKRSSPSGVRMSTARFRLMFEMCGNGPCRVEGERGEHRVDDVVEVAVGVLALVLVELVVAEHVDAVLARARRAAGRRARARA